MEQNRVEKVSKKTHGGGRIQGLQGFAGWLGKPSIGNPYILREDPGWFGLGMFDVRRGVVPLIHGIPFKLDKETNGKSPFDKSLQRLLRKSARWFFILPRRPAPQTPKPTWAVSKPNSCEQKRHRYL